MNRRVLALACVLPLASPLANGSEALGQSDAQYELARRPYFLGLRTSGVYDSNIDHSQENIDSQGVIAGIEARLQTGVNRPLFTLTYDGTLRRFAHTDRWNRVEHRLGGLLYGRSGPLTVEVFSLVDLRGATEDRELGNSYTFLPRLTLRIGPMRVRGYGALRLTTIADNSSVYGPEASASVTRDDVIVYGGGETRWEAGGGSSWTFGYRFEESESDSPSQRYNQQRYLGKYNAVFWDHSVLEIGLEYRPRRYPDKLVEVEQSDGEADPVIVEEPREDVRWIPRVSLSHVFPWGQEARLDYEYQHRTSNDPYAEFEAHRLMFTLRLPLVSRYKRIRIDD